MKRALFASAVTVLAAVGLFAASDQAPRENRGLLSTLEVGQPVNLFGAPNGGGVLITVYEKGAEVEYSQQIVEVGSDYLVLGYEGSVDEMRIPVHSIKWISTAKDGRGLPKPPPETKK